MRLQRIAAKASGECNADDLSGEGTRRNAARRNARYADLLFEVVTRRYEQRRPILVTTNKLFGEWNQVFPNASCVGNLIDRLLHRAEILALEGKSYRLKEAEERAAQKAQARSIAARSKR